MNKINNRIESIFAQAAALKNTGRFKTIIHCIWNNVYLLNSNNTVILKFPLRKNESSFESPIHFSSSDYDSRKFYEEDGKIVFISSTEKYERKKICGISIDIDIEKLYQSFPLNLFNTVLLTKDVCSLLEDKLSHVELSVEGGEFKLTQRDIYSGTVIEIRKNKNSGLDILSNKLDIENFGPVGLRTIDFLALFSFQESLYFKFEENVEYCGIKGTSKLFPMSGIIAHCIYDELGIIKEVKNNGREEQKNRRSESKTNSTINKTTTNKRKSK